MKHIELFPVGVIHSPLKSLDDCPLQGPEGGAEVVFKAEPRYSPALKGISKGNALIILTWLHAGDRTTLQCYPRRETHADVIGVFATRSPDRPNPIGLHRVTVTEVVSDTEIRIFPMEVIDGTRVIDVKVDID
jgi:L-fuculose-phosphate aldolase